ncbi:MAG TPA: menaquinone biosynthesis protein [Dongiaceae bacterium]|nr:menaquinone biosynthesis protein [Dongiaceae bacterium]
MSENIPKAPLETAEGSLVRSLAPFRVGSVRFLNAVPLTRGLEEQVFFATPSELAARLERAELDAALVSVTEPLRRGGYDILDGVAIASVGEVKSVFLAHRGPLEGAREVFCDPASLTSIHLLRVLLAERGVKASFKPLASYDFAALPDYALLIGDTALDFLLAPRSHRIWDLGAAWHELTGLPFVYAVWALRRGFDNTPLRRQLRQACQLGLDTLDSIVRDHAQYDYDFRNHYLRSNIHYRLGADEKRGLARFAALLQKHGLGPVFPPRYVV